MEKIKDIWDESFLSFLPWDIASTQFGMIDEEFQAYNRIQLSIPNAWIRMLTTDRFVTHQQESIGLFIEENDLIPYLLFSTMTTFKPRLAQGQ